MNQNKIDLAWNFFKQGDFSSAENILVSLDNNSHNYSSVKELFSYIYANTDRVDLSIELLKEACSMEDASPEAHYYLGAYFLSNEQFSDAIISFSKSLKIGGNFFEVIHDLATAHARIGNLKTALEFYLQCLSFNNNSFLLFFNIATIYNDLKNFSKALTHYDRAIELKSDYAEAWMNKGVTLYELKQFKEALTHYDRAIELKSDYAEAWMNKGVTLYELKQFKEALTHYDRAIELKSDYAEAWMNKGVTLYELKQFKEALTHYDRAIELKSDYAQSNFNKACILFILNRYIEALTHYDRAIELKSDYAEAWMNKGVTLYELKQFKEALTHYDRAIELKSDYAEAWMNKGVTLYELKQFKEALTHYDRAIELKSDYAEAWMNKGVTLYKLKQYSIATKCYEKALDINPTFDYLMGDLFFTKMMICDWSNYDLQVNYLLRNIYKKEKITRPFSILGLVDSPELLQISAEVYSSDLFKDIKSISIKILRGPLKKIKIGYFSADFYNHATSYLMAELFEKHNREKFEIIGFSFGESPNDHMFKRIASSMDEFHLVKNLSDLEIAKFSRDIGIDIAVDLKGYTYNARPNIFSHRCAPIQINYLGFPGTLGSNNYDYIIADSFIVPQHNQKFYTEKIIYLPHCYQVNDSKKAISSTQYRKKDFGLPDNKFIYCSFNNTYKITPIIFDAWMQILKTVENSVLWLFEENEIAANNLRIEAKKRGVDMNRLIFAERLPLDEHLSRLQLADLFIDTFPCNGHTTTSDALWAGIPGVTLAGESFSSRVAGSLLNTIGAPELITYSINDYINLAIDLASSREKFFNIKNKVAVNRITSPLFDINLFTENIELTYQRIYTNSLSNS